MKKKLMALVIAVALIAALTVGLVACDKDEENPSVVKIGAIYINSQNDPTGYTYAHHNGIKKAMEELGMPASSLKIVDNVPEEMDKVSTAVDSLVGQGCNMIIGISFGYIEALTAKAEEYPNVVFSHATGYESNETNYNNYFGRIYQSRYLSGIAAGLKSLELGNNNLGYVAAWGTEYAETCSGINAFALGAQSVNPNAVVKIYKINAWGNQELEGRGAQELIDNGCGIIAQHCDSAQPQIVAAENNAFGCGYNSDMTPDAPTAHLTAPIWHWNVYYKAAIEAAEKAITNMKDNVITDYVDNIGAAWYGGLKSGFVDISPLSANCAAGTADAVAKVRDMMIAWEDDNADANGFDVFGGYKLNITVTDGVATVTKTAAALLNNGGNEIIAAGGAYIGDNVIKGTMDYYVAGVSEYAV